MPPTLLLKLLLTPALIVGATLVGRRWGHVLSGWLVGLPLTSGPVVLFLALDQGTRFAAAAALGVILGVSSQAVFALAYVQLGREGGWTAAAIQGIVAFALATAVFEALHLPGPLEPLLVFASLILAIKLMPGGRVPAGEPAAAEPAELPLRIVIATALVVALTAIAPLLGPRLSGLLSPFPLYAAILAIFAHRRGGAAAARLVWRGLLFGLFAFLAFFSVLAAALVPFGIGFSFMLAIVTALAIQAVTLITLHAIESSQRTSRV